jgi:hypothetical protein
MPSKDKQRKQKEKEEAKQKQEEEQLLDEYWNEGTNKKKAKKADMEDEKQAEKMRKAREMKELLEADEENMPTKNVKKSKKKKDDDFAALQAALKSAPKTKAQKEAERKEEQKKQQKQEQQRQDLEKREEMKRREEERLRNIKKGLSYGHEDMMNVQVDNSLLNDEEMYNGIDEILLGLDKGASSSAQGQAFQEFYDAQLPNMKEEFPGLKMSQYKDKIFQLWRRRENRML